MSAKKNHVFRADRMRARREQLGLTQIELGARMKRNQSRITAIETQRNEPQLATIIRIAEALECSTDYLLGLVDDPQQRVTLYDLEDEARQLVESWRAGDVVKTIQKLIELSGRK